MEIAFVRAVVFAALWGILAPKAAASETASASPPAAPDPVAAAEDPSGDRLPPDAVEGAGRGNPVLATARDLARGVEDLGHCAWGVVSAPARMDRRDWLLTAGVFSAGGLLFAFDEDIDRSIARHANDAGFRHLGEIGNFLHPVGLISETHRIYQGGILVGYALRWDRFRLASEQLVFAQVISGTIRRRVRNIVGRNRPFHGDGAYFFQTGGGGALPSGHAATAFLTAEILAHHANHRSATILLYGLASTVAYQRLESRWHWASDVWIGAAWGVAVAKVVIRITEERRPAQGRVRFGVTPTATGPVVGIHWIR